LTAILTALLTALLLIPAALTGVAAAQPATSTAPAGVPWSHVGTGWVLTQYTTSAPEGGKPGPVTLYLISPGGARYKLASWPDIRTAPQLLDWSPDGKRALFQVFSGKGGVENLTLATGQVTTFALPGGATPIRYTTPGGLNIVAGRQSGSQTILARYDLSGRLARPLGSSADGSVLYQPSGAGFVTGTSSGLKLVSNGGALVRKLPVPGTSANTCNPVRWWNATTILASCAPPSTAAPQLWLVPLGGGRPAALTPRRGSGSRDLGDLDAWSLSSGLYLQAAGPCGVLQIFKQARNGSIKLVTVPHTEGDNHVLTASGSRLLIQAPTSCVGSNSLLWYNPGTHAEQWLIRAPSNVVGVENAVPFYSRQNGNM
jgi:TolB protein